MLYTMRVKFEDGSEGELTLSSNITPENLKAGSETARQAVYYHFPDLKIADVIAVSFSEINLDPETYSMACELKKRLEEEIQNFSDWKVRKTIQRNINALIALTTEHDIELSR